MATKRAKDLLHPYDNRFILSDWQLKESWSNLHVLNIQAGVGIKPGAQTPGSEHK